MSWAEFMKVVFDYQALIAGLVALVAAYITARPVWRQLKDMSMQTNMLLRDYVLEQIRRTSNRRTWYGNRLGRFNDDTTRRIYEMEELESGGIDPHWAFDNEQRAERLLRELEEHSETRDLSVVEGELAEIKSSLAKLIEALDSIHRPFSMDQHDADHSFSDEEWADLKVVGEKAEQELSATANELSEASDRLDKAFARELHSFREQLTKVHDSLKTRF